MNELEIDIKCHFLTPPDVHCLLSGSPHAPGCTIFGSHGVPLPAVLCASHFVSEAVCTAGGAL